MSCCSNTVTIYYNCKTTRISDYQNGICLSAASFVPRVGDTIRLAVASDNIGPDPQRKFKVICVYPYLRIRGYDEYASANVSVSVDVEEIRD